MAIVPNKQTCINVGLALYLLVLAPGSQAAPDFPAPPRAQVQWVSSNMVYNGRVMQVRRFDSRLPARRVMEFYRNTWKDGSRDRPGFIESDAMTPWRMISRLTDEHLLTVQVMAEGNDSTGYLTASSLDDMFDDVDKLGDDFPMMGGSKVVNDIKTPDTGKKGRTLFLSNEFTVNGNANYYRDYYDLRGWRVDMDQSPDMGKQHVLAFSKGRQQVNIVITRREDRSFIVANSVE